MIIYNSNFARYFEKNAFYNNKKKKGEKEKHSPLYALSFCGEFLNNLTNSFLQHMASHFYKINIYILIINFFLEIPQI